MKRTHHVGSIGTAVVTAVLAASTQAQTLPASPAPTRQYDYDPQGHVSAVTLAPGLGGFGFATRNTYDSLGRLKDSTDARSGKTQFGYSARGDVMQVTDPRSLVTQYPRNGLGDATSLVSPDTGTANQTYDPAGNLKTRTDSRGILATYGYDALDRLTSVVYSGAGGASLTQGWAYDQTGTGFSNGIGRLTSTSHPAGSTQYTYDPQGRVLTDTQRVNGATGANSAQIVMTVVYGYDAAGHVTSITYPSGRRLCVTYANGVPTSVMLAKDAASTASILIGSIQWEPFGGVSGWQWQMAAGTQPYARVYDGSGRLVRYRLGSTLRDLTYDAANRIAAYTHYDASTGVAIPGLNQSFGYDELGRLTGVSAGNTTWTIGYDANGNRTGMTAGGALNIYTTSSTSNRLTNLSSPARTLSYDIAGNTIGDSGNYTASYDLAGRLATLTKAGVTATYSVDGMGRRVRKFTSAGASSTVVFAYDQQGQLLGEYDNMGKALREYVWLGATPVAMFTPDAVATNPPMVFYIHADHLNTPRVVVDKNNVVRWRWLAEPFGTTAPETNPSSVGVFTQNLRFPGQYADQESGLFYNWNRYLDVGIGRYNSSDPIGLAGGMSTYAYVEGNPISDADPNGLQPVPRGTYLPRGPAISGPPSMTQNNAWGTPGSLMNQFGNLPNPAPELPGDWVGINVPWTMPRLIKVCDGPYPVDDPNAGGVCREPSKNSQGPFLSSPGQGPVRSCSSFHYVAAP